MASAQEPDRASKDERLRNLEILKYGHAIRIDYADDRFISTDSNSPRLGDDAILTALCQLAAVRLNCSNAFICLNDLRKQHVLAEGTKTISPYDQSVHAPNDGLMFGVRSFDRAFGITNVTLPAYTKGARHFISNAKTSIDNRRSIFLDLQREPLLVDVPFLQGDHPHRFYFEVPLRNNAGVVVGIVGVLDEKPRSDFADVDTRPLLDAARMTMEHLELVLLRGRNAHADRLLQGLTQFNAGKSSISGHTREDSSQAQLSTVNKDRHDVGMGQSKAIPADTMFDRNSIPESSSRPSMRSTSSFLDSSTTPSSSHEDIKSSSRLNLDTTIPIQPPAASSTTDRESRNSLSLADTGRPQANHVITHIHAMFARAATLIREAMDLEATCFFDVPTGLQLSRDSRQRRDNGSRSSKPPTDILTTPDQHLNMARGSSDSETRLDSSDSYRDSNSDERFDLVSCPCIASSQSESSESSELGLNATKTGIPERSIKSLVSLYPAGHMFYFDALGLLNSSDDSESSQDACGPGTRRRNITRILSTRFPKARSLLFVPLYNDEHRLSFAFFGWIGESFRALTASDVVYVAGFANSIMCEVMRLEALALEKMKSAFVSSISHELRSPLHGILAATELLRESKIDLEQTELALMMESCGRTLLDIMNNVLEHAKINNTIDNNKHKRRGRKRSTRSHTKFQSKQNPESAPITTSLAEIIEETVSSAMSGHSVKILRTEQASLQASRTSDTSNSVEQHLMQDTHSPIVVLDIQQSDKWYMHTDPGIWRRIVLNLVGNALKYTASGHVIVKLSMIEPAQSDQRRGHILFTVSDTGRGMSENYMRTRLYSPFAQEDHLSVGVGLGLSIVHRLVTDLSGKVDIDSEVHMGTKVRIVVPFPRLVKPEERLKHSADDTLRIVHQVGTGRELVCFCGFKSQSDSHSLSTMSTNSHELGLVELQRSLSSIVIEHFKMGVTSDLNAATLFIVEANYARALVHQDPQNAIFSKRYIVIQTYSEAKLAGFCWPGRSSVTATPVGPLKLARAFNTALQQKIERLVEAPLDPTPPCSTDASKQGEVKSDRDHVTIDSVPRPKSPVSSQQGLNRILLVDDNDINVRILAGLARKLKFPYCTASNGQEALDQYKAAYEQGQPFQYVFMDISMPVMDGLESTRCIRAYEQVKRKHSAAQIFALTGLGHAEMQEEAAASGIDQYFRKPVRLDTLRRVLLSEATA